MVLRGQLCERVGNRRNYYLDQAQVYLKRAFQFRIKMLRASYPLGDIVLSDH